MNNRKPSKKSKSALKIEALEPRLLMSAAPDWNTQLDNLPL